MNESARKNDREAVRFKVSGGYWREERRLD